MFSSKFGCGCTHNVSKAFAESRPGLTIEQTKYVLRAPSLEAPHKIEKVMVKDNMEYAYPNVEISLRLFLTLMITNCSAERSFSQLKHIKIRI